MKRLCCGIFLITALCVGCLGKDSNQAAVVVSPTVQPSSTPFAAATVLATAQPSVTPLPTNTYRPRKATITATKTRVLIPTSTPEPMVQPPPGIVYRSENYLWITIGQNESVQIIELPSGHYPHCSLNGTRVLCGSTQDEEIWDYSVTDLGTGERLVLNASNGHHFCYARWWNSRPDVVLAAIVPDAFSGGMACKVIPAVLSLDENRPHLLGDTPSWANIFLAPSADGTKIAFEQRQQPWLYEWGKGSAAIDLASYGFQVTEAYISHPAWSPVGSQIAWLVHGDVNGEEQQGIGILDLEAASFRFLYPYQVEGYDGGRSILSWSHDGRYLYLWNFGFSYLWVLSSDGAEQFSYLDSQLSADDPVWSPTGPWLAFTQTYPESEEWQPRVVVRSADGTEEYVIGPGYATMTMWSPDGQYLLFETNRQFFISKAGSWDRQIVSLPHDAQIFGWEKKVPSLFLAGSLPSQ